MKCKRCGYQIAEDDRSCPVCGAKNAVHSANKEQERARRRAEEQAQEAERARRRAEHREQENERERAEYNARQEEEETIVVDPRNTFMNDNSRSDGFSIFDLFGFGGGGFGGFGGSPFGSAYSSQYSRTRQSFGLFDIIDDMFFGGSSSRARNNRAIVTEKDDFYYIDKFDDEGFPIFTKDKLINISPSEFAKIKRESNKDDDKGSGKGRKK